MIEEGIIKPSNYPSGFELVVATKVDGTRRVYLDSRPLNKRMEANVWPLSNVGGGGLIKKVRRGNAFSPIDVFAGY